MMTVLARAELFVLAVAVFALLSAGLWSLAARRILVLVSAWEAARRHTAVLLLILAPAISTTLLFAGAIGPSLLSLVDPALDHCIEHDDGHVHLCFLHWPQHAPHALLWVVGGFLGTWIALHALMRLIDVAKAYARLRVLLRTGETDVRRRATILEGDLPFCATAGLLAPRVLVSRRLLNLLSTAQQEALFAHEASHVRRRDALLSLAARTLDLFYPRPIRQRLERALELAAEQACDEHAARVVGDRLTVAETILCVERALAASPTPMRPISVGMNHSNVAQRVESLLAAPRTGGRLGTVFVVLAASVATVCLFAVRLHHAIESLLSPFLR